MTKKPVKLKKLTLDGLHDYFVATMNKITTALSEQAIDTQHRLNNVSARVDGAWGKLTTLEARISEVNGHTPPPEAQSAERYCVIGDKATCQYPISRSWKNRHVDAEAYAASLIRNSNTTEELYVVKIVSVVRRKPRDVEVTRV